MKEVLLYKGIFQVFPYSLLFFFLQNCKVNKTKSVLAPNKMVSTYKPSEVSIRFKYTRKAWGLICHSSQPGIAKRHTEMNMKKQYSHAVWYVLLIQHGLYQEHIQTEMSVILSFILLFLKLAISVAGQKQNAFHVKFSHFSSWTMQIYVFCSILRSCYEYYFFKNKVFSLFGSNKTQKLLFWG